MVGAPDLTFHNKATCSRSRDLCGLCRRCQKKKESRSDLSDVECRVCFSRYVASKCTQNCAVSVLPLLFVCAAGCSVTRSTFREEKKFKSKQSNRHIIFDFITFSLYPKRIGACARGLVRLFVGGAHGERGVLTF